MLCLSFRGPRPPRPAPGGLARIHRGPCSSAPVAPVHTRRSATRGAARVLGLARKLDLEEERRQVTFGGSRRSGFHTPPHHLCSHAPSLLVPVTSFSERKARHAAPLLRPYAHETAVGHGMNGSKALQVKSGWWWTCLCLNEMLGE